MSDIVIGTGRQKTIREVASILASQLFAFQGAPRKITARSGETIDFTAERSTYDGPFETFHLRARVGKSCADALRTAATENPQACYMSEELGWQVMDCPPLDKPETPIELVHRMVDQLCSCLVLPEVWRVQGDHYRVDPISIELLFQAMIQYKASDVHLSPGEHPVFRIDNQTRHSELLTPLSAAQIYGLIRQLTPDQYWAEFESKKQTSFNYHQVGLGYARVSAFIKSSAPHCTLRFLPETIPSFEALSIPRESMVKLAQLHRGLVLITGMTGSGKTTTAAALIDWINSNREVHIVTIEDPIEYVHHNKKSILSQRCLGSDVNTFAEAVVGAMRHDPDVMMLGEMRDSDTVRAAITAASTGHLVISTLHSNTAPEVVSRIVSFFDPIERDLVKMQLRDCLQCIICQRLVARIGGGRIPALEMLFNDIKPVADGIDEGNTDAIRIAMQQTGSHSFLFEEYLVKLYRAKKIELEQARTYASDVTVIDQMLMGTYSVPRLEALKAARDASQRA